MLTTEGFKRTPPAPAPTPGALLVQCCQDAVGPLFWFMPGHFQPISSQAPCWLARSNRASSHTEARKQSEANKGTEKKGKTKSRNAGTRFPPSPWLSWEPGGFSSLLNLMNRKVLITVGSRGDLEWGGEGKRSRSRKQVAELGSRQP